MLCVSTSQNLIYLVIYRLELTLTWEYSNCSKTIENRIYREEFTRKKYKTAILLYCFHTSNICAM